MTGYAVSSRIQRIELRSPVVHAPLVDVGPETGAPAQTVEVALVDLAGRSAWARLRELREDVTTAWRQTTFFLFDPESWR